MIDKLKQLGLSSSQAVAYQLLVDKGQLNPADLVRTAGESRTNAYMVLDRLVDLGLATKDELNNKMVYRAANPQGLQRLIEAKRENLQRQEQAIKTAMPSLIKYYHEKRTEPGVRFYQGSKGINQMYNLFLQEKSDKYYIRTTADEDHMSLPFLQKFLERRAKLGIHAEGIAPDIDVAMQWGAKNDKRLNRTVTYLPAKNYTAPVEISVGGDKTCFISFGEEVIGVIIESQQIAEAMRQAFLVMKRGAEVMMIEKDNNKKLQT